MQGGKLADFKSGIMRKVYEIVEDRNDFNFKKRVQDMLDKGWELHGPTTVLGDERDRDDNSIKGLYYIQAFVKDTLLGH